ncbi:MAG: hypothetical protein H0X02_09990, partial [Nitrosomonas sp.]|nr:hypothetical protein [Nitrosomonas sp.]
AWAAGDTNETVRDIIQLKLLGNIRKGELGQGLIPGDLIADYTMKKGVADTVDTIYVKHVSGKISSLSMKSYDQGRESFQGTLKHVVWLDEEPPIGIYTECLLRTMGTKGENSGGLLMLTFTPLEGMSETVLHFLDGGAIAERDDGQKCVIMATWDHAVHLSDAEKEAMWNSIPPYQREARSKGIPTLGSGAIYPIPESDIVTPDIEIPEHWPRAYGLDVGWNRTAVVWGAWDRDNDVVYITGEHYRGEAEPAVHAQAIKSRGEWIPGSIDPAARGRAQDDGKQLLQMYMDLGLDLDIAFNGVEAGIYEVLQRLSSGRLKVFKSCQNWLFEFRLYRRDEKGRIVKKNDHAMDATRYLIMSGLERAKTKPKEKTKEFDPMSGGGSSTGWMG